MNSDSIGPLLSAAGVGALLSKAADWVLERSRKRASDRDASSAAEIADNAAMRTELWKRLSELEKLNREIRDELDRSRATNAELSARLLSTQAELEALRAQSDEQQREIEALQRAIGRAASETGKHPVVT